MAAMGGAREEAVREAGACAAGRLGPAACPLRLQAPWRSTGQQAACPPGWHLTHLTVENFHLDSQVWSHRAPLAGASPADSFPGVLATDRPVLFSLVLVVLSATAHKLV